MRAQINNNNSSKSLPNRGAVHNAKREMRGGCNENGRRREYALTTHGYVAAETNANANTQLIPLLLLN